MKTKPIESEHSATLRAMGAKAWAIVPVSASEKCVRLTVKELKAKAIAGTKLALVILP